MVKQNLALLNEDGKTHCKWCAPKEIERLLRAGKVRKIAEKGKPIRYALRSYPQPSNSADSPAEITTSEMQRLPAFGARELKRLAKECQAENSKSEPRVVAKVRLIQRWMGHGLIERNAVTELIASA